MLGYIVNMKMNQRSMWAQHRFQFNFKYIYRFGLLIAKMLFIINATIMFIMLVSVSFTDILHYFWM